MTVPIPPGEIRPAPRPGRAAPPPGATRAGDSNATEIALWEQTYRLHTLNRIARAIASDLDLDRIVQTVTDAATELIGAKFGAFFYNAVNEDGESYVLYTLSGVPREAFEQFGLPRKTALFAPTFEGSGIVRSDDIRKDPRYGLSAPHFGMPKGHLPVVSYLAVPVISRSGEVHGGLFFGHDSAGMFTEEIEEIVAAIASHAAIAIDNARLLRTAKIEAARHRQAREAASQLAAIVESSDVAILSIDRDGVISSWNKAAERLFGYAAREAIGKPVTIIVPESRHDEHIDIVERIPEGEYHRETVRRRKDGSLVDISLTVSPIRDAEGNIIGASKIARDITERRRAHDRQQLLLHEMNHRVKNLFAVVTAVASLSVRAAESPEALGAAIRDRVSALARAHDLTLPDLQGPGGRAQRTATLLALLQTILAPYGGTTPERIVISGCDVPISGNTLTSLALLLHEFATNSAKYGALSVPDGRLAVELAAELPAEHGEMRMVWTERNGPALSGPVATDGFGSRLERGTIEGDLHGSIVREWRPEGMVIRLTVPMDRLIL